MTWHRTALAALALVAAAGVFAADAPKPEAKGHDRLDAMAAKLGLNDQQKDQIREIHKDYGHKLADAEHQLWTLHHEEHEAMGKVLTDEQRAKVPGLLKAARDKDLQKMAGELGITDEQKKELEPILEEHEKKFHELAAKGEGAREQYHQQRHEFHEAIAKVLTNEQREKLPGVLREEYHQWRDPVARRGHLKALADELGLSAEQRTQVEKIHKEYDEKTTEPASQLKQLRKDEHAAVDKVLTDEQRAKVQKWRQEREAGEKKPAANEKN